MISSPLLRYKILNYKAHLRIANNLFLQTDRNNINCLAESLIKALHIIKIQTPCFRAIITLFFNNCTVLTGCHPLNQAYHVNQSKIQETSWPLWSILYCFLNPNDVGGKATMRQETSVSFQTFVFLTLGNNTSLFQFQIFNLFLLLLTPGVVTLIRVATLILLWQGASYTSFVFSKFAVLP